ncbi:hypothetical protein GCM10009745_56530 [Kribbella yunnanensis]|uniref:DUF4254 domain-containing protein n=1 Tax=Kribbella yunnanensis TaxID=190194 RepID=A0ABN2IC90_9ACTN
MPQNQARDWLGRHLGAAEIDRFERVSVQVTPGRSLDLVTLVLGWYEHVTRIERELGLPDSDRSVWGAHDLIAADILRDLIDRALEMVPLGELGNLLAALDEVGSRFRSYTEADQRGALLRLHGEEPDPRGWWWDRIPCAGPIRRELDRLPASF